ncbi:Acetyltransferase [Rubellimicrobium mesophilum DSM 19309]|uniref:Acetyltransferase n=1 Tax=Rubellimicrobium mesophilum DSM 19309 TaxID=442562 RepID=A0A017HVQ7_9RHOB|nr:GNAT family N-acetyltransferase [Rubellimicrobium mesophilum]EYD77844.1 Acetyltransferase [Rubellimicrobium mesophilum DSM 19309]
MSEVEREDHGSKRRYVIRRPEGEAELTLSVLSPTRVIADHTYVPDALRGQGLAEDLLDALLSDARAQGFTIVPLCPYVASQARRHLEWAALFAT